MWPFLQAAFKEYTEDAEKPGFLNISFDAFAKVHQNEDVKISIDGKKLASRFGKELGEGDLCGFETKPTLSKRKPIFQEEMSTLKAAKNDADRTSTKAALLISISILSVRVKDLREYVVKKNVVLMDLLRKAGSGWINSEFASPFSFNRTRIMQSQSTIKDLLGCIDNLSYAVACLNGTQECYIMGSGIEVVFDKQTNYVCLVEPTNASTVGALNPWRTKQRTEQWHELRRLSKITGNTLYKAIGLGLLREEQAHYDKVYTRKVSETTPELQELFDYGTQQEPNTLATLLAEYMPVYLLELLYVEDGCCAIPLGMTISE